jgi:cytochrome c-type biogenesis protein CcmF
MSSLTSLYLPGAVALWGALLFALATVWGYTQVLRGRDGSLAFARRSYSSFAIAVVAASLVMFFALATRDFRVEYVQQYSGLDLPLHFQLAAFWAGQKGSFMIWLLWGVLLGIPLVRSAGRHEPTVMVLYTLTLIGLVLILVRESPFLMLGEAPADGKGLNPLLQDNWMVIHPPIMFVGFAASAVPFCFAMSALWRRQYDSWAARAFPWALGGFLVLGGAILMGGYWAYDTLGWGGYWGWDPVENASLIPWLFGAVLIHGLYLERTKNRFRRANYVLSTVVYIAVLYGTFLTRSGVLADFSVHSFVDLGISGWLIALLAFFLVGSLVLLVVRLREVPTEKNEDPMLSRGAVLVLSTITLLISALVVTFGTSAPLLTRFMKNPGQVGPEWYNQVHLPIALLIALLLTIVPFLTWRGESGAALVKKLAPSLAAAVVGTGVGFLVGVHSPFHLLYLFLAVAALAANLHKAILKARALGVFGMGGYLTHVGVGVMLIGFLASSGYDQSTKVTLLQGVPTKVGDLTATFKGFKPKTQAREKDALIVEVVRENGKVVTTYPKLFQNERSGQMMANPDVTTFPLQDLYVSPIEYDAGRQGAEASVLDLKKGQAGRLGDLEVRFDAFDLHAEGDAMAQMAQGGKMTIGARIDVTPAGGSTDRLLVLYRIDQAQGAVEAPPTALPGGGAVSVGGINASDGAVRLLFEGVATGDTSAAAGPRLSVDISTKPLIQLVWGGFYVLMIGGVLSLIHRMREVRKLDQLAAAGKLAAL